MRNQASSPNSRGGGGKKAVSALGNDKLGICARHKETRNELANLCCDFKLRVDMEKGPDGSLLRPRDVLLQIAGNGGLRSPFAGVVT